MTDLRPPQRAAKFEVRWTGPNNARDYVGIGEADPKGRLIDMAKQTLAKLTSTTLAAGTPFALRVLGREVDSCQTDLEIALAPLNAAAVAGKIAKLEKAQRQDRAAHSQSR